jgi:putative ubiquitin-RnfH superfamily antitoxin RatB of RatAB toxin-antitoxin module
MRIEVVYARADAAEVRAVDLPSGGTVKDALAASGFQLQNQAVGVFGKRVALDHRLTDGDRVEIYRPLAMDPKEARRRRAAKKK